MKQLYGLANIFYGTTSGNSKAIAYEFAAQAQSNHFITKITNLGDFNEDNFAKSTFSIFFLSTYGTGGPPEDSERFYTWLLEYNEQNIKSFIGMKFIMFGLGNTTFDFYCGFSKKIRDLLLNQGARQIYQFGLSDAKSQIPMQSYQNWKKDLFKKIIEDKQNKFEKKTYSLEQLKQFRTKYQVKYYPQQNIEWEKQSDKYNLNHEIKSYLNYVKCQILDVRQIRKSDEGRSTLYIKIKNNKQILIPACNIQIIPQNIIQQNLYKGSIQINSKDQVPFPLMPLNKLMKILNLSDKVSKKFLQEAMLTCSDQQKIDYYTNILKDTEKWQNFNATNQEIAEQFQIDLSQKLIFGINKPRVYTLAGWNEHYIQLMISLFYKNGKIGLASNYFLNRPQQIRIKAIDSRFQLPVKTQTPIVMIANGTGMAPFRSLLHYFIQKKKNKQPINKLILFYGCQQVKRDFYFEDQWRQAEKQGLVEIHLATSREGEKIYVQKLLEKNISSIKNLIFTENATFMICGSTSMAQNVNSVFMNAFKLNGVKPYLAMMKVKQLEKNHRIQKEIFG